MEISKADWKIFQTMLPKWQEAYIAKLIKQYADFLNSEGLASAKFWELSKRIKADSKNPGVLLECRKSNAVADLISLISYEVIGLDDLDCFSGELKEVVTSITGRGRMMYEEVKVLTHSSIKISGSKTIYFDSFNITDECHDADIIFVTHAHYDHYSEADILKVSKPDTILVIPECMKGVEGRTGISDVRFVHPNAIAEVEDIMVKTTPAYNDGKPFHPKSDENVGYVITLDDTTYFVAGDTDAVDELKKVRCDVALVPVGGKFTMEYKAAAALVNEINPKLAIPTHYGSIAGDPDDGNRFAELVDAGIEVRVMI